MAELLSLGATLTMEPSPIEEYKELGVNMRHYGTHYGVLAGVFFALTGLNISIVFGANAPKSVIALILLKFGGLFLTFLFGIKVESAHFLWGCFIRRAAEIEPTLGFKQYSSLPGFPKFWLRPAAWSTRIMFICLALFWIVALFIWPRA